MTRIAAQSARAADALTLVEALQQRFVSRLQEVSATLGAPTRLEAIEWGRDDGRHGGGVRYCVADTAVFDRGSVNVSQVHYDDQPDRALGSATALSTIIHPANPHAASMHMHLSWTQMRDGTGTWRMMADLNPSIEETAPKAAFEACLRTCAPDQFERATAQGERYFFIPALGRHRGIVHFYLEGYRTPDADADAALAQRIGHAVIDTYSECLRASIVAHPEPTAHDRSRQLAYHTLYLLQVLTLDRGTTSGLLVHDQNDVGTLGSLPSHVDPALLASWVDAQPAPQDQLLAALVDALGTTSPAPVTTAAKRALATIVREHYRAHPEALALQAAGDIIPPTVANHR